LLKKTATIINLYVFHYPLFQNESRTGLDTYYAESLLKGGHRGTFRRNKSKGKTKKGMLDELREGAYMPEMKRRAEDRTYGEVGCHCKDLPSGEH